MDLCLDLYSIPLVNIDTLVPKLFIIHVITQKIKFFHFVHFYLIQLPKKKS